jgi:hypothetical protein
MMRALALALVCIAACGDDQHARLDGGPCWPLPAKPGGQVTIGTGEVGFQPMPDVVTITRSGGQASAYLPINAQIRGMPPGNPDDFFDPKNPKTKVSATLVDTGAALGVQIDCPASIPYVASTESGTYEMLHALRIDLGMTAPEVVANKQAILVVEVVGSNGVYAMDQKQVTMELPPAPPPAPPVRLMDGR